MKKIALAITTLVATTIPEQASAEKLMEDDLKQESSITVPYVREFLKDLSMDCMEEIEESDTIKNYLDPANSVNQAEWDLQIWSKDIG